MAKLLDGRLVSNQILEGAKKEIEEISERDGMVPKLAIILVGENPASLSYIKQKRKAAEYAGLEYEQYDFNTDITQEQLTHQIRKLNEDMDCHGILVQLPLPEQINMDLILKAINPRKDVDGFHAYNLGKMFISQDYELLTPCTPKGIIRMLEHYDIDPKGLDTTIVGHSNIVGKPMAVMLMNRNATVTVCHIDTKDLSKHTREADLLISATGVPGLIKEDMVKEGAIIVDVGCVKVDDKLCGDVEFDSIENKASYITPVPGGVGPMTVACLIENTVTAYKWLHDHNFDIDLT